MGGVRRRLQGKAGHVDGGRGAGSVDGDGEVGGVTNGGGDSGRRRLWPLRRRHHHHHAYGGSCVIRGVVGRARPAPDDCGEADYGVRVYQTRGRLRRMAAYLAFFSVD